MLRYSWANNSMRRSSMVSLTWLCPADSSSKNAVFRLTTVVATISSYIKSVHTRSTHYAQIGTIWQTFACPETRHQLLDILLSMHWDFIVFLYVFMDLCIDSVCISYLQWIRLRLHGHVTHKIVRINAGEELSLICSSICIVTWLDLVDPKLSDGRLCRSMLGEVLRLLISVSWST